MNNSYAIKPTDVVHGKEWKTHKYIKKVMNNGKWVYYYTMNRARGNKVTNKNAKYTKGMGNMGVGRLQYSPSMKTYEDGYKTTPIPGITNASSMISTKRFVDQESNQQKFGNAYTGYLGLTKQINDAKNRKVRSESISSKASKAFNSVKKKMNNIKLK